MMEEENEEMMEIAIELREEIGSEERGDALQELLLICVAQQELIRELQDQAILMNPGFLPMNREPAK